ncbi:hypothetical protein [Sphingomonas sp.]|uniref:hypothetical protein n=1 Tax=Sphingomonas sp. TaxID=28214 RepID=UPI002DD674A4|nr:hypothetical protein [Sphingomonas sp.]
MSEPVPETTPAGEGPPAWLWWLAGVIALAAAGGVTWRRLATRRAAPIAHDPPAAADMPVPPTPSPPARPVGQSAVAARAPVVPPSDRGLLIDFHPQRMWTRGPDAFLAFELVVTNATGQALDGIRPAIALASAGPETAAEVAAFRADAASLPTGEPFDLRAGETRSLSGELTLAGGAMYVTTVADREMIVPLALVALRWRAGLALTSLAEAFVIGTGDAASRRLGPIWVDRAGQVYPRLDARRFATPGS